MTFGLEAGNRRADYGRRDEVQRTSSSCCYYVLVEVWPMMYVLAVHPTLISSIILEADLHEVLLFRLSSLVASEHGPPPLFMLYAPVLLQCAMQ
jgi:hypothetical protein